MQLVLRSSQRSTVFKRGALQKPFAALAVLQWHRGHVASFKIERV